MSELVGLLELIAPFFGLIAIGFACAKFVRLERSGLAWMQFFLIYIALPCLFFRLVADKPLEELANWSYIAATTTATACAFALAFAAGWRYTRELGQSVMQGVAGSYSNIGYMGPPLILAALGPAAAAPVVLIFVFDNLLLFSLVPFLMALAGGEERRGALRSAGQVLWRVATHPFNVATLLGVTFSFFSLQLPTTLDSMTLWLSNAAAPSALFLLGVTVGLAKSGPPPPEVPVLVVIKLVIHPLLVWVLLSAVGNFDPMWVFAAIVMAALPPALNIFVISTQYGVGVERASACVLVGTIVSVFTLTAFLWLIRTGLMPHDLFP
ncbi:MAG: AEC family transporter [Salinarimonadaceae bacterium]|nr:MAG: AEC family transporter [Salinarimonadaceae bacterium]